MNISIGKTIPLPINDEGPRFVINDSGITIICAINNPDSYEIDSFKSRRKTKIGALSYGRLGFIIVDFGEGFEFDVPFDIGRISNEYVPNLELWGESRKRIAITLIGCNHSNQNKVFGIRLLTASLSVSETILKILISQIKKAPIDEKEHSSLIEDAYRKYPLQKNMVEVSVIDLAGLE